MNCEYTIQCNGEKIHNSPCAGDWMHSNEYSRLLFPVSIKWITMEKKSTCGIFQIP